MCDTQALIVDGAVWFAKNSDREPSEPQPVIRVPAVRGDRSPRVRVTYLEIDQVPDRHAVILSKPSWIWGAEMGANDVGVVIGNEAIFSRVVRRERAFLGMDLVRLGLERGGSAREALEVVTRLLELHGQGGPAGYRDKRFCYDSSFLIADAGEAWVLETAGHHWAAKRAVGSAAISNCLTITTEYDLSSAGLEDFARRHGRWDGRGPLDFARAFDTRFLPWMAKAHRRVALSRRCLAETSSAGASFARLASHLRQHAGGGEDPVAGSNADLCMHATGPVRRSQTTGSMISRLSPGEARHFFTGTSAPCLSMFRLAGFDGDFSVLTDEASPREQWLWFRHEAVHRRAIFDGSLRGRLREERDRAERSLWDRFSGPVVSRRDGEEADRIAEEWQVGQENEARRSGVRVPLTAAGFFWRRLNRLDGVGPT
jgi:secernin